MIKLATWDFNGTLLADTDACVGTANHIIKQFEGAHLSRKLYINTFTFPALAFYASQGCNMEDMIRLDAVQLFHDFYETRVSKCRTRRGAREILDWFKNQGAKSIILSNHTNAGIKVQLERLALTPYIHEILGNGDLRSTEVGHNKVHRMGAYFERTGIDPKESLIVGDAPEDIGIGKQFGMHTAAITGGYYSTSRLRTAKPDYLIGNLLEVKDIVERLNSHYALSP